MRRKRRTFNSVFKTKVELEALKERQSVNKQAEQFEVHPYQISTWQKEFLLGESAFGDKKEAARLKELEQGKEEPFKEIGKLSMQKD